MKKLIERFSGLIKGSITGFDRIVFKGFFLPLMSARGAMQFCGSKGILNKNYKNWMMRQSARINKAADEYGKKHCGRRVHHLSTWHIRKEELAHKQQQSEQIKSGLIGIWSCLESCSSYRARYCEKSGYPQLRNYQTRCKHLYFYFDHDDYGFMNIRLQTWFPYHIQVCLNGREWLRRSLEKTDIDFLIQGNKFLHISDYDQAQTLLNKQLDVRFTKILNGFVPIVFPMLKEVLGPHLSYYWTMWQSEWATDLIFPSPAALNAIMDPLLRHAHMTGTSTNVLRYLDRPLTMAGKPYARSKDQVLTRLTDFNEGIRVRHWVDKNSVKVYSQQNVLRVETTINNPAKFRVFRNKNGQSANDEKSRLPLRKGVVDIPLRAKISQEVNDRFMNDLSTLQDQTPAKNFIDQITCHQKKNGRRFRALDPTGKDRELLQSISNPKFRISGLTNKMLRQSLSDAEFGKGITQRQLSAKISRHFRLFRVHGLIRKLPKQNRYQLTLKGVRLTNILNAFLAASTEQLIKIAA